MRVASGRVIDGHDLAEADQTFEVDETTERMLLDSIAQCERGQTVPFEKVLDELRRRG